MRRYGQPDRGWIEPEDTTTLHFSSRRDNVRVLPVPFDLAAKPVNVPVQDLKDLIEPWCQYSIFRSIRLIFSWIEHAPKYVIEITLPRRATVVGSDENPWSCSLSYAFQL
jgi:hypothetical protein